MAKYTIQTSSTSNIFQIFIQDSTSSVGIGKTSLNYTSLSTAFYHRDTAASLGTSMSMVSMNVGTYAANGFKEIDQTNMPGWYQFAPPDAAFVGGANNVGFHLAGGTNMAPLPIEVQLDAPVTSNIKKGQASRITFVMTDSTTHAPKTGVSFLGHERSLDGASLASTANAPSSVGAGLYTLVLGAADTGANELAYRFTGTSCDDLVIERVTQP